MQLDAHVRETSFAHQKADPIRVVLADTGSVGSRRKGLRIKRGSHMTCTACDGCATRIRREHAPARRLAPARPCPAPAQRSVEGIREWRKANNGRRPLDPSTPDRSDVP